MHGFFDTLSNTFHLQHNEMIKSLPYCKFSRQNNKETEEWIKKIRIAVEGYNYKELDRQLKEKFIHGLNDNEMLTEIVHKLTTMKDTSTVTIKQILACARWVEAWWPQTAILDISEEIKEFDAIGSGRIEQKVQCKSNGKSARTDKEVLQLLQFWPPTSTISMGRHVGFMGKATTSKCHTGAIRAEGVQCMK